MKAMHIESRGAHEQSDYPKRIAIAKRMGANPSCTYCEKEGHDEENCWKLHPELRHEKNDKKGK